MSDFCKWCVCSLIALTACVSGCGKKNTPKAKPDGSHLEAADLWDSYRANPEAADEKYRKKELVVSGKVESVGRERGRGVVVLQHPKNEEMSVRCYFLPADLDELEPLAKNAPVKIKGTCVGKVGADVTLINCHVQK
jgi:hypothetical protein